MILAYFCCPIKIRHPFYFTQHRKKKFFFAFDSSFPSLFFHPYPLLPFFYPVSETPPTNLAEKNKKKKHKRKANSKSKGDYMVGYINISRNI